MTYNRIAAQNVLCPRFAGNWEMMSYLLLFSLLLVL
jgi:hypothetical protein